MPEPALQPPGQESRPGEKAKGLILLIVYAVVAGANEAKPAARSKPPGALLQGPKDEGRTISRPA